MKDARELVEGDPAPSRPGWRHRAVGMTLGEAMSYVPRTVVVEIDPPLDEWRLIRAVAAHHGLTTAGLVRRLLHDELVRCGIAPDAIPYLSKKIALRVKRER